MTLRREFDVQEESMINVHKFHVARITLCFDTREMVITVHVIILSVGYQIAVMNECRSMNGLDKFSLMFRTSIDKQQNLRSIEY